jgi:hypothetical protein
MSATTAATVTAFEVILFGKYTIPSFHIIISLFYGH